MLFLLISPASNSCRRSTMLGTVNHRPHRQPMVNTLVGNAGVNILDGQGSADIMSGLGGNDTYYVDHAQDFVNELAYRGSDIGTRIGQLSAGVWKRGGSPDHDQRHGVDAIDLAGNGHAQVIVGNAGANILQGRRQRPAPGQAGNDTLIGGAGTDKFLFNTALNAPPTSTPSPTSTWRTTPSGWRTRSSPRWRRHACGRRVPHRRRRGRCRRPHHLQQRDRRADLRFQRHRRRRRTLFAQLDAGPRAHQRGFHRGVIATPRNADLVSIWAGPRCGSALAREGARVAHRLPQVHRRHATPPEL